MVKDTMKSVCDTKCSTCQNGMCGGFYCLTALGVAIYYIGQTDGFWLGVLGVLKAIVWPVYLVYKVYTLLGM